MNVSGCVCCSPDAACERVTCQSAGNTRPFSGSKEGNDQSYSRDVFRTAATTRITRNDNLLAAGIE